MPGPSAAGIEVLGARTLREALEIALVGGEAVDENG